MRKKPYLELVVIIVGIAVFAFTGVTESQGHNPPPAQIENLLLHMPLDGSPDDYSPLKHQTTSQGVTASTDRHGNPDGACRFTNGSYITVSEPEDFNGLNEFTLSAWVCPSTLREHLNIISKVTPHRDFNLQVDRYGQVLSHIMFGRYEFCYTKKRIAADRWSHITATYSNKNWKIYIDGVLDAQVEVDNSPPWTSEYLTVGNLFPGSHEAFLGDLDEVRVYNRALTASEVKELAR